MSPKCKLIFPTTAHAWQTASEAAGHRLFIIGRETSVQREEASSKVWSISSVGQCLRKQETGDTPVNDRQTIEWRDEWVLRGSAQRRQTD